jgi:hypothetical protein
MILFVGVLIRGHANTFFGGIDLLRRLTLFWELRAYPCRPVLEIGRKKIGSGQTAKPWLTPSAHDRKFRRTYHKKVSTK